MLVDIGRECNALVKTPQNVAEMLSGDKGEPPRDCLPEDAKLVKLVGPFQVPNAHQRVPSRASVVPKHA